MKEKDEKRTEALIRAEAANELHVEDQGFDEDFEEIF